MSTSDLLAGTVMDKAASLMNDTARTVYSYTAQVPYLQMAMDELQEEFQLHNMAVTEETSAVIPINTGLTEIIFNGGVGFPTLPTDFIEPKQLWERFRNSDPFVPMRKVEYLPHYLGGVNINQFLVFTWSHQKIEFLPSNTDNDIKIDYIKALFTTIANENSLINVINAKTFLEYRTAGLLAEFIERNLTSANAMNAYAVLAKDRVVGINSKGKQQISTRRRPFRSAYKRRRII
jgi:hypothetical protein